jgi:hypothetical protein
VSGTVNIARALFQDEAFKDQPYTEREAFMWLVMEASWKDRVKRVGTVVVDLKRGQLAASVRFMADAWSWEKSTVDRFLKRLEKRDMIGIDSGTGVNVITIRKYNNYQGGETASGTAENEKRDSSGTAAGQTRIPEAIPENTQKEIGKPISASPDGFDEFWQNVPRRIAKPKAQQAYAKALRKADARTLIAAMRRYAESRIGEDPQYTAHPTSWLNAGRWNDEPDPPKQLQIVGGTHAKTDRRQFDAAINETARLLSAGTISIDHSSRDPFAGR